VAPPDPFGLPDRKCEAGEALPTQRQSALMRACILHGVAGRITHLLGRGQCLTPQTRKQQEGNYESPRTILSIGWEFGVLFCCQYDIGAWFTDNQPGMPLH
jgi:hypothetical protein